MDAIKNGMLATAKAAEAAARIGERLFCQNTPNVMNFNSQICTSREQSGRLLAIGLKPETADMVWLNHAMTEEYEDWKVTPVEEWDDWNEREIPAWSLHRLIEMALRDILICGISFTFNENAYDKVIKIIEYQIKGRCFPKEYLV